MWCRVTRDRYVPCRYSSSLLGQGIKILLRLKWQARGSLWCVSTWDLGRRCLQKAAPLGLGKKDPCSGQPANMPISLANVPFPLALIFSLWETCRPKSSVPLTLSKDYHFPLCRLWHFIIAFNCTSAFRTLCHSFHFENSLGAEMEKETTCKPIFKQFLT